MEYDQSKILYTFILHLVMIQSTIYKDSSVWDSFSVINTIIPKMYTTLLLNTYENGLWKRT